MASNPSDPETSWEMEQLGSALLSDGFAPLAICRVSNDFDYLLTAEVALGSPRWSTSIWPSLAPARATS